MIDFEFCINTGNSLSICCRQPTSRFHENKIMTKKIYDLETSGLITDYEGA